MGHLASAFALWLTLTAPDGPHIEALRGEAALLIGSSSNVLILRGNDGLLLVDDQRSGDYREIRDLLTKDYRGQEVTTVLNTHWHLDHAGGNALFAAAGARIIAQRNVRKRLSEPQYMTAYKKLVPASPPAALPARVFDSTLRFRFGREVVRMVHVAHAHTDGDAIVRFEHANVLHMGDLYFGGMLPFIDLSSGGSVQGYLHALDVALGMSDDATLVVPGHGPVGGRQDLLDYRAMIAAVSNEVRARVRRGESLEQILSARPAARYELAGDQDRFVTAVYTGWARPSPKPLRKRQRTY